MNQGKTGSRKVLKKGAKKTSRDDMRGWDKGDKREGKIRKEEKRGETSRCALKL